MKRLKFPSSRPLDSHSVGCRGTTHNSGNHNQALLKIYVIDDTVISNTSPLAGRICLQALDIAVEGIDFHRQKGRFNASLILWLQISDVFLRGLRDLKAPIHE